MPRKEWSVNLDNKEIEYSKNIGKVTNILNSNND